MNTWQAKGDWTRPEKQHDMAFEQRLTAVMRRHAAHREAFGLQDGQRARLLEFAAKF
ncbi:hypothetical protein [Paenibacillus sp. y28]|uniref:hypothetical protein n=1 Tax=Paenibacillus sp. y28 TaxID=3129110 RepID=UPI00301AEC7F